jgi:hypothetical protein
MTRLDRFEAQQIGEEWARETLARIDEALKKLPKAAQLDSVMCCPLCHRPLVTRYRVLKKYSRRGYITAYHPLWYCETHDFTVEINHSNKKLVKHKPNVRRKRSLGSASNT